MFRSGKDLLRLEDVVLGAGDHVMITGRLWSGW